jgi:hypothetical protein
VKTYLVTIPLAGHIRFEVEAESEEQAIELANQMETEQGEMDWGTLTRFNQGNVCYCPSPWEIETEIIDE